MKFSRVFVLCILLFLLLVFAAEYRMPKKFRWEPTYSHTDKNPFGCYVFDSVLTASLSRGYTVGRQTLYQLKESPDSAPKGILVLAESLELSETDIDALFRLAGRGCRVILSAQNYDYGLRDTLHFNHYYGYSASETLLQYVKHSQKRDTIVWHQDSLYARREFLLFPQVANRAIWLPKDSVTDSLPGKALAGHVRYDPDADYLEYLKSQVEGMAVEFPVGKGAVLIVPSPLVFTNYTVLDTANRDYIFRLLSRLGDLPVVRTEAYQPRMAEVQASPLRFFLQHRPLRWALWLSMLGLLLFMLFTARRRQRPIPVVREPQNRTVEFVQLIGTLYYQRHDYRDLVLKKYTYFSEELRRHDAVPPDTIATRIRQIEDSGQQISAREMTQLIQEMDEIIKNS